ncbi:uncharacterized protein LOC122384741 isoform X2 [Amphibalanus amphitrite]|uniref:uncharacterized protein LOC122384741 isoform X2 n=1 Tax=Amphibalanus amphitrite TaxID=1232801 RepID=UPI001C90BF5A|nr:uncharacterized protein LOC122384741 isoform X2 [Amphibalanus amphitrite]
MEPARPPEQPKSRLRRRSSILKAPASPEEMTEDLTSRRSSRRVSFADRFRVQEFFCDEVTMGGWAEAYDKEAQITDSSGDATAAARGAPLLGVLQNSNASASMELTGLESSFGAAPAGAFPAHGGHANAFEASVGPVPMFLRENSDPDKENMAPRPPAAPGVGVKKSMGAVADPEWLAPGPRSPGPSAGSGLLQLLGDSDAPTPPFLRNPAPGGVLDMLRRAGVVSAPPPSPPSSLPLPITPMVGRSALELLGGDSEAETPEFLRYLDALDDDFAREQRHAQSNVAIQESYIGITSSTVSHAPGSAMAAGTSQFQRSRVHMQTVSSSRHMRQSEEVLGGSGKPDAGQHWVVETVAACNRTVVDSADMELTSAFPPILPVRPVGSPDKSITDEAAAVHSRGATRRTSNRLDKTLLVSDDMELTVNVPAAQTLNASTSYAVPDVSCAADMELTAAVPRLQTKLSGQLNKSVVDEDDMALTAAVARVQTKPSGQLNKSVVDADDMELTAAVPRVLTKSSGQLNKSVVDGDDMELTAAVPRVQSKSIVGMDDMELTAAVPRVLTKSSGQLNKSVVDMDDMELTAAVPRLQTKPSGQLNKSVIGVDDMELTAAVPRVPTKPSGQLNKSVVDGDDMELTAAVAPKPSGQLNKSVVDGDDMELTAAVPRALAKSSGQLNKSVVDGDDMELTAAVPRVQTKPSGQLNKSIVDMDDMELTAAVPRALTKPSGQPNKSVVGMDDMELTAAVPRVQTEPSAQLNKSIADMDDMELTGAVPRVQAQPSGQLNKSVVDMDDMELTAAVPRVQAQPSGQLNKSIVDMDDMELTAAVPRVLTKSSGQLNKSVVDMGDMELTAAVPQVIENPSRRSLPVEAEKQLAPAVTQEQTKPAGELNKSMVDEADMELTAAVSQVKAQVSAQMNKSVCDGDGMESSAASRQVTEKPSTKNDDDEAEMELTAAVPQLQEQIESSGQVSKSIHDGAGGDMDLTSAVSQITEKSSNKNVLEADIEMTAAVPQVTEKPSSKSIGIEADMELTATVPQKIEKPSSRNTLDRADMDLPAAALAADTKSSSALNKSIVDGADMELTAAVPQTMARRSVNANKSICGGNDMGLTTAAPQVTEKPSSKSLSDEAKTATIPQVQAKLSGPLNKTVLDGGDMELTTAVSQVPEQAAGKSMLGADMESTAVSEMKLKSSSHLNKSIVDGADMELTSAVPQATAKQLSRSVLGGADMELTAAVPETKMKPSSHLSKSIVGGNDMDLTAAVSRVSKTPSTKSIVSETEMEFTAVVPQVTKKSSSRSMLDVTDIAMKAGEPQGRAKSSGQLNKSIADGADMELTAAVPGAMVKLSSESMVDGADMELPPAYPQVTEKSSNKYTVEGADLELSAAQEPGTAACIQISGVMTMSVEDWAAQQTSDQLLPSKLDEIEEDTGGVQPSGSASQRIMKSPRDEVIVSEAEVNAAAAGPKQVVAKPSGMVKSYVLEAEDTEASATVENKSEISGGCVSDPSSQVNEPCVAEDREVVTSEIDASSHENKSAYAFGAESGSPDIPNASLKAGTIAQAEGEPDNTTGAASSKRSSNGVIIDGGETNQLDVASDVQDSVSLRYAEPAQANLCQDVRPTFTPHTVSSPDPSKSSGDEDATETRTLTRGRSLSQSLSCDISSLAGVAGEVVDPAPKELGRTSTCRRPAVDSPCRPSSKRGRLFECTTTPSPPKRPLEGSDDSPRSPKSPRLEMTDGLEKNEAHPVDSSRDIASDQKVFEEREECGSTDTRLPLAALKPVSSPTSRPRESIDNVPGDVSTCRSTSDLRSLGEHAEVQPATATLERDAESKAPSDASTILQRSVPVASDVCEVKPASSASEQTLDELQYRIQSSFSLENHQDVLPARPTPVEESKVFHQGSLIPDHRDERRSPSRVRANPGSLLAESSVSDMFLGTPPRADDTLLEPDLNDEKFPDISVINDSPCAGSHKPPTSPAAHAISRRLDDRDSSGPPDRRSGRPPVEKTPKAPQEPSPPVELRRTVSAHGPCWASDGASQYRRTRALDDSPKSRRRAGSPERRSGRRHTTAVDRVGVVDGARGTETITPGRGVGDRRIPALPPPFRMPDCKSLVRGLRAQLEAYRRAREASERETQAVVEAALARMRC